MSERIECPVCEGAGAHFTGDNPTRCGCCLGLGNIENVSAIQLEAAFNDGFAAAKAGFAIEYCPISLSGEGRIEWQKGWHDWTKYGD